MSESDAGPSRSPRVLVICTANICRSPMAAALLGRHLDARGMAADISSAGLLFDGRPVPDEVLEVMADRSIDLSGHRSRILQPDMLADADLVVGMAREHLREAVVRRREIFGRSFTLKELVRLGGAPRGRRAGGEPAGQSGGPDRPWGEWLATVGSGRRPADLLGASSDDDVADPIGGPLSAFRATAAELDQLCERLAGLLAEASAGAAPPA